LRPRIPVLLISLALLTLTAPGCGESKEDKFKDDFKEISNKLQDIGRELGVKIQSTSGKSNDTIEKEFGALADDVERANGELKDLDPPDDLKDETERLTSKLDDVVGDLEDISSAAGKGSPGEAGQATIGLIADARRVDKAQKALTKELGLKVK
jgi:gas vesicle protein